MNTSLHDTFNSNHFTGLLVVDPTRGDTLYSHNAKRYFTPASNVKIFTLYTGLKLLPKQIPALKYVIQGDTVFIQGTGDPSWLHPYFKDNTAIEFLSQFNHVALYSDHFDEAPLGPGWAWEDYPFYFSPERSAIPLYGNVVTVYRTEALITSPAYFEINTQEGIGKSYRLPHSNHFFTPINLQDTLKIPFITSNRLTKDLLQGQLKGTVTISKSFPEGRKKVLSGMATDSIYKRMLHESDNFLAEQLVLTASSMLSDTLSFNKTKDFMLDNHLEHLKQQPRWVDGSGLSRYNLFTPESFAQALHQLFQEYPQAYLFELFPKWDASGTIKNHLGEENENAFIYAKSGSLGNNYNLSGYLKTKSGKTLIFSFMNNHYQRPTSELRLRMYQMLKAIHENN